jgi:hypothetical protein
VYDENDRTRALVRVYHAGRIPGLEAFQHAGNATEGDWSARRPDNVRVALALCLLFDRRTDRLVTQLWDRLETQGVATLLTHTHGRHRPHLSYAVLRDGDLDTVRAAVALLPSGGPLTVTAQGSVVFPRGRVALACAASADVVERQERVVAALRNAGLELHRNYEPGRWVPHVSVATSASGRQVSAVVSAVSDVLPLPVHAVRAAVIETGTGELWPLPVVP